MCSIFWTPPFRELDRFGVVGVDRPLTTNMDREPVTLQVNPYKRFSGDTPDCVPARPIHLRASETSERKGSPLMGDPYDGPPPTRAPVDPQIRPWRSTTKGRPDLNGVSYIRPPMSHLPSRHTKMTSAPAWRSPRVTR